jgi:hypothetical protein
MNSRHISVARLFQAAEGRDLESSDLLHFQNCSDCQKLLSSLTRHATQPLQGNELFAAGEQNDLSHLPIRALWEFAHDKAELNDGGQTTSDGMRAMRCNSWDFSNRNT